MINLRKAAVFTGLCFIALAAHAAQADTAEVPVDNHPMGYYAEVQTEENPMTAPIDAQGNLAPIDEEGQTVKEDIQKILRLQKFPAECVVPLPTMQRQPKPV